MKWEEAKDEKGKGGKKRGCLLVIVAIVAIAVVGGAMSRCGGGSDSDPLEWPTTGLATMLPEPDSTEGTVIVNSDESFSASIDGYTPEKYESYLAQCQEMGYTVDAESGSGTYSAYSADGYYLSLSFFSSSEGSMSVSLDAPIEMGALTWPTSGPGSLVPAPASATGKVNADSSTRFSVSVGETSAEDYAAYVDACMAAGFDVDYSRGGTSFSADNADGAHVSVTYEGFNTMRVSVDAPEEVEPAPQATEPETGDSEVSADSASSDFRAFVDGYEAFMNEYVDFMITYNSDSANIVTMALEYADMMARYADWAGQVSEIDEGSLSADDLAYYLAAVERVNARLLEIGQ